MLNRINQLGLTLAVFAFAGLGTAHAQDENPCGDDMENPCMEDTGDDADMDNPCGDANPCGDDAMSDDGGGEEAAAMGDDGWRSRSSQHGYCNRKDQNQRSSWCEPFCRRSR